MEYSVPALPERPRTASTNLVIAALATCVVVASLGWWAGRATAPDPQDRFTGVEVLVAGHPSEHQVASASTPAGGSVATGAVKPSVSARSTPSSTPTTIAVLTSPEPSPSRSAAPGPLPTVTVRSAAKCVALGLGHWEVKAQVMLSTSRGVAKVEAVYESDGDEALSGVEPMSGNGSTYTRVLPTRPAHFVNGDAAWFARVTMADGRVVESASRSHEVPFPC
ncbi:hypothetical protein F4553_005953 [Allocatelliglobosispora scoriae]|uniref:Uncharacterized protein n=1 Tax=Allocatelliglobosispora scoriae TaxID=643052 RepID=A0A841BZJ6_9ACTN|nr:hypothetical protein [Allocatelliglobosispora scoriae]MBB5872519.1 hypothetical protein [Allocatelliglobosispora scoriae]